MCSVQKPLNCKMPICNVWIPREAEDLLRRPRKLCSLSSQIQKQNWNPVHYVFPFKI